MSKELIEEARAARIPSNPKRYLVYRSWNGRIHTTIEYGDHVTGEGKKNSTDEVKRVLLKENDPDDLEALKVLYPLEKQE